MIPHEREMVKRLGNKPFTLLGINSDQDRSALKTIQTREKITWPSIAGGPPGQNPIAKRWNVHGWPTLFIIDHEGVIRYRDLHDDKRIEQIVDELLAKVPKAKPEGAAAASQPR